MKHLHTCQCNDRHRALNRSAVDVPTVRFNDWHPQRELWRRRVVSPDGDGVDSTCRCMLWVIDGISRGGDACALARGAGAFQNGQRGVHTMPSWRVKWSVVGDAMRTAETTLAVISAERHSIGADAGGEDGPRLQMVITGNSHASVWVASGGRSMLLGRDVPESMPRSGVDAGVPEPGRRARSDAAGRLSIKWPVDSSWDATVTPRTASLGSRFMSPRLTGFRRAYHRDT